MADSFFAGPPVLIPLDDGVRWRLKEPFAYWRGPVGKRQKIEVPAGFETDFASVPRIFWRIFPPWGRYGRAAILHDHLYATQMFKRSKCDRIFLEAMTAIKVPWLTRHTIYRAVRMGGFFAYNNHKKKRKSSGAK